MIEEKVPKTQTSAPTNIKLDILLISSCPNKKAFRSKGKVRRIDVAWQTVNKVEIPQNQVQGVVYPSSRHYFQLAGFEMPVAGPRSDNRQRFRLSQQDKMHMMYFRDSNIKGDPISYYWCYNPVIPVNKSLIRVSTAADFEATAVSLQLDAHSQFSLQAALENMDLAEVMDVSQGFKTWFNRRSRTLRFLFFTGQQTEDLTYLQIKGNLVRVPSNRLSDLFLCLLNMSPFGRASSSYARQNCQIERRYLLSELFDSLEQFYKSAAEDLIRRCSDSSKSLLDTLSAVDDLLQQKLEWWDLLSRYFLAPLEQCARPQVEAEKSLLRLSLGTRKNYSGVSQSEVHRLFYNITREIEYLADLNILKEYILTSLSPELVKFEAIREAIPGHLVPQSIVKEDVVPNRGSCIFIRPPKYFESADEMRQYLVDHCRSDWTETQSTHIEQEDEDFSTKADQMLDEKYQRTTSVQMSSYSATEMLIEVPNISISEGQTDRKPPRIERIDSKPHLFARLRELFCRPIQECRNLYDALSINLEAYMTDYTKFVEAEVDKCDWIQDIVLRDLCSKDKQKLLQIDQVFRACIHFDESVFAERESANYKTSALGLHYARQDIEPDRLFHVESLGDPAKLWRPSDEKARFDYRFAFCYDGHMFLIRKKIEEHTYSVCVIDEIHKVVPVVDYLQLPLRDANVPFLYKNGRILESAIGGASVNKSILVDFSKYSTQKKVNLFNWSNQEDMKPHPLIPKQANFIASMGQTTAYYFIVQHKDAIVKSVHIPHDFKTLKRLTRVCTGLMRNQQESSCIWGLINGNYSMWVLEEQQMLLLTSTIRTPAGFDFHTNLFPIDDQGLLDLPVITDKRSFNTRLCEMILPSQRAASNLMKPMQIQHMGMCFLLVNTVDDRFSVLLIRNKKLSWVAGTKVAPSLTRRLNHQDPCQLVPTFACWMNAPRDLFFKKRRDSALEYELGCISITLRG